MPSCIIPDSNGKAFNLSCRGRYYLWICHIWTLLCQGTIYKLLRDFYEIKIEFLSDYGQPKEILRK